MHFNIPKKAHPQAVVQSVVAIKVYADPGQSSNRQTTCPVKEISATEAELATSFKIEIGLGRLTETLLQKLHTIPASSFGPSAIQIVCVWV
jgi:hypothetical protein